MATHPPLPLESFDTSLAEDIFDFEPLAPAPSTEQPSAEKTGEAEPGFAADDLLDFEPVQSEPTRPPAPQSSRYRHDSAPPDLEEEPEDLDAQIAEFEAMMESEQAERRPKATVATQPVKKGGEAEGFGETDMFDFEPLPEASCEYKGPTWSSRLTAQHRNGRTARLSHYVSARGSSLAVRYRHSRPRLPQAASSASSGAISRNLDHSP
jgi:hypothetical protein